jgi:hypothetical protein
MTPVRHVDGAGKSSNMRVKKEKAVDVCWLGAYHGSAKVQVGRVPPLLPTKARCLLSPRRTRLWENKIGKPRAL